MPFRLVSDKTTQSLTHFLNYFQPEILGHFAQWSIYIHVAHFFLIFSSDYKPFNCKNSSVQNEMQIMYNILELAATLLVLHFLLIGDTLDVKVTTFIVNFL